MFIAVNGSITPSLTPLAVASMWQRDSDRAFARRLRQEHQSLLLQNACINEQTRGGNNSDREYVKTNYKKIQIPVPGT